MLYCTRCGAQSPDGVGVCVNCGAPFEQQAGQYAPPIPPMQPVQPMQPAQPNGKIPATMGAWAYVGAIILMSLPVIGFILTIVWACGGCKNMNKANLARAYLLIAAICIVLCIVLCVIFGASLTEYAELLNYYL